MKAVGTQLPDKQLPAVFPIGFLPGQRQTTEHLKLISDSRPIADLHSSNRLVWNVPRLSEPHQPFAEPLAASAPMSGCGHFDRPSMARRQLGKPRGARAGPRGSSNFGSEELNFQELELCLSRRRLNPEIGISCKNSLLCTRRVAFFPDFGTFPSENFRRGKNSDITRVPFDLCPDSLN